MTDWTNHRDEIIEAVRAEVPRQIDIDIPHTRKLEGRCLPATRMGVEALAYFGIEAKPLVTLALSGNGAWADWADAARVAEDNDEPIPDMPDEAWSVGIDPTDNGPQPPGRNAFPGHLVIEVNGILLDLDARIMSRPEKFIYVPETVALPLREDFSLALAGCDLDDGGILVYMTHPDPPSFKNALDWKASKSGVGPVIRRVKKRLG